MNNPVEYLINMPFFWLFLTIIVFKLSQKLKLIKYFSKIPPIIFTSCFIFFILSICSVSYGEYNESAQVLTFLLFPATIALAYPLVDNFEVIKNNKRAVSSGVLIATFVSITAVVLLAKFLNATQIITLSLVPKSITTPIALEVSKNIGGIPELTACTVVITGIFGGLIGHRVLKFFKIKHNLSIGLAIGAASHALGTSRCIEKKEPQQAAASGLTLILVALCTAIFAPLLLNWLL